MLCEIFINRYQEIIFEKNETVTMSVCKIVSRTCLSVQMENNLLF